MSKSLDGIKILDLTRLLPGAICSMILADMGADVIKVEDPFAGDYARNMPPFINGNHVLVTVKSNPSELEQSKWVPFSK